MITDYASLQAAIADWLNRSDLSTQITDFIAFAELRIARELRIKAMEASLAGTISSGVIAVPSSYIDLKHAYINSTPVQILKRQTAEFVYREYPTRSSSGKPVYIAREADNFIFGPYPDSNYAVAGIYYKRLGALSSSNTTNWFVANAPDLLLYASITEACTFLKDDKELGKYEALFQRSKAMIEQQDRREELSGSALATR